MEPLSSLSDKTECQTETAPSNEAREERKSADKARGRRNATGNEAKGEQRAGDKQKPTPRGSRAVKGTE
ncbi:unnamed protein product [Boreogadus saida]